MQSYKASDSCEICLAAAPTPNWNRLLLSLTLSHSFQPKATKYTHSEKCNWKPPWNYFRHSKKPKHTLLNNSEGNETLGTQFLHHELKPSVYQMSGEEKHVKTNCLYTATEECKVGQFSY